MIRLLSVFVFLSLLITGYVYSTRSTEANVVILSPDRPCELFRDEPKMYETCREVWAFERANHDVVQISLD